jgi:hypothetical protein
MLAIPMLQAFATRRAFGAGPPPPKRLVIVGHQNGRVVGTRAAGMGAGIDRWSPGKSSQELPSGAPSEMLRGLEEIREEIVTFDGIDNIVRHATGHADGHHAAQRTALTCRLLANDDASGPSIDYVAGLRLRSGPAMWPSVVIRASATPEGPGLYPEDRFYGDAGTAARFISGNPRQAILELFGPPVPDDGAPPPTPTLRDRLAKRRRSILDGVIGDLKGLRGRVNARDREQLDRHTEYIRSLEQRLGPVVQTPAQSCERPDETLAPQVIPSTWDEFQQFGRNPDWERGTQDNVTVPYQVENLVQAIACDVTRVACLSFQSDPNFAHVFDPEPTPFSDSDSFHQTVHGFASVDGATKKYTSAQEQAAEVCRRAFRFQVDMFTLLVKRLGEMDDTDGSRVLDNTLVLWFSELGYGSTHQVCNLPIIMAGLGAAFPKGRHIVENRRTTGDLFAHVLRLLGGSDETFGETGTLGALAGQIGVTDLLPDYGLPGYIDADTPLHRGALSL